MAGIYWVLINSVFSFVFLYIIAKLLGKKQISQLDFVDYVVGISLGSIAAQWSVDDTNPFYYYIIAMSFYFVLAYLLSIISRKTPFLKNFIHGKPLTIIYEGKFNYKQLKKSRLDVNEVMSMLRIQGYFDINDVAYGIFETNGQLSVLPKGNQKPVVIEDIGKKPKQASLTCILIVDGRISYSGLNEINKDRDWLYKNLNINSKRDLKKIIYASYDNNTKKFDVHYKKQDV